MCCPCAKTILLTWVWIIYDHTGENFYNCINAILNIPSLLKNIFHLKKYFCLLLSYYSQYLIAPAFICDAIQCKCIFVWFITELIRKFCLFVHRRLGCLSGIIVPMFILKITWVEFPATIGFVIIAHITCSVCSVFNRWRFLLI